MRSIDTLPTPHDSSCFIGVRGWAPDLSSLSASLMFYVCNRNGVKIRLLRKYCKIQWLEVRHFRMIRKFLGAQSINTESLMWALLNWIQRLAFMVLEMFNDQRDKCAVYSEAVTKCELYDALFNSFVCWNSKAILDVGANSNTNCILLDSLSFSVLLYRALKQNFRLWNWTVRTSGNFKLWDWTGNPVWSQISRDHHLWWNKMRL